MNNEMAVIRKATRQGVKPLIGLYSESGCGKTYSSLLLARGFVGPAGKIVMVDTESGRGSLYADVLPGGYEVLELRQPFAPARYIEAVHAVEASGATICVVDSVSHEWEGQGGVLDMATANEEKSGKPGLHNWKSPKMEHAKFMLALLQSPLPIIVCCRAKYKTRQTKDERGKTAIVKDDYTTPIQADDFIFEMTAHCEILQKHNVIVTKCSHPTLRDCFPGDRTEPIGIAHGEALARWCEAAAPSKPAVAANDPKAKRAELWKLLATVRGEASTWTQAECWLLDRKIIANDQSIVKMNASELQGVINKADISLSEMVP